MAIEIMIENIFVHSLIGWLFITQWRRLLSKWNPRPVTHFSWHKLCCTVQSGPFALFRIRGCFPLGCFVCPCSGTSSESCRPVHMLSCQTFALLCTRGKTSVYALRIPLSPWPIFFFNCNSDDVIQKTILKAPRQNWPLILLRFFSVSSCA